MTQHFSSDDNSYDTSDGLDEIDFNLNEFDDDSDDFTSVSKCSTPFKPQHSPPVFNDLIRFYLSNGANANDWLNVLPYTKSNNYF